jgi:hypothetical protein
LRCQHFLYILLCVVDYVVTSAWSVASKLQILVCRRGVKPARLDAAFDLYRETEPRILISHEGPSEIVAEMLAESSGNYAEAKRACVHSRTKVTLQRMIKAHAPAPAPHYSGHYHRRWTTTHGGTTLFRCLKEMEVCEACQPIALARQAPRQSRVKRKGPSSKG